MKKRAIIAIASVTSLVFISSAASQELGVRFGQTVGDGNVAIDGVYSFSEVGRVHADLSFSEHGVGIEGLWNPLYRPLGNEEAFNWYVGVGAFFFLGDDFGFGVPGEIGVEYHFKDAPIAVGADWRPTFIIVPDTDFWAEGFGFNVRYVFK